MGRPRTKDEGLPKYIARKGGAYYFVTPTKPRRWIALGLDRGVALAAYPHALLQHGHAAPHTLLPSGYTPNRLMDLVRRSSRNRGIENGLTLTDLAALIVRAGGRCEVSGMPFSTEKPKGQRIRLYAPSVDRIDPKTGYLPGNCRLVCAGVNVAMNAFGDRFLATLRFYSGPGVSDVFYKTTPDTQVSL